MASAKSGSDETSQFIQRTIRDTERNMASLRQTLAGYLRNQERLRRKSLKLAVVLKIYSESEAPTLSGVLASISELLTEREVARENATTRINILSQEPLKLYSMHCSKMKNEVKAREVAMKKEHQKQEAFDKTVIKEGTNRTKINQTQLELTSAHTDTSNVTTALLDSVHRFESTKRADLRTSLGEFLWNEMNYHAQALEILTEAHQMLLGEDLDGDIQEIEEKFFAGFVGEGGWREEDVGYQEGEEGGEYEEEREREPRKTPSVDRVGEWAGGMEDRERPPSPRKTTFQIDRRPTLRPSGRVGGADRRGAGRKQSLRVAY
ncbi:FAM92 protein-domain-containing protein [Fimicolochytrium jonesii]|uniref:FAM92 protein-domain-containing protein n=1 Tax=Fimicolochytrium jonesii TaxID=1396493 RepID=UPI0022FE48D8|nr:FAM92 protein-domain-containing protein [Fimicolochytrium jonesii]KAI8819737.1 FAM92 protein-domain-containing protein [Fimicolochytrium jonesii]